MVAIRKRRIRIVNMPSGEAPLEIRKQWIGLELPLAGADECAVQVPVCGVLTGIIAPENTIGYPVFVEDAISLLEMKSPAAAAWWRANTPHLFTGNRVLIFEECVCQMIMD